MLNTSVFLLHAVVMPAGRYVITAFKIFMLIFAQEAGNIKAPIVYLCCMFLFYDTVEPCSNVCKLCLF